MAHNPFDQGREEVVPAKLIFRRASEWTDEGRKEVADWLRQCAENLEEDGSNYSASFTATFRYAREKVNGREWTEA